MKYFATLRGQTWEIGIEGSRVTLNGEEHHAELHRIEGTPLRLLVIDGRSWSFPLEPKDGGLWHALAQGEAYHVEVLDERAAHIRSLVGEAAASVGPTVLKAPMPGLVVRVLAFPGQKVVEGTSLIVLEAMKMENELKAPAAGIIQAVSVTAGQTVERGQPLVQLAPLE
jgi:biotin carboxyl carrier protein